MPQSIVEPLLLERIAAQVRKTPDRLAIVSGAERLTYQELDHASNRLARHLQRRGVGPEDRVGVHLGRGSQLPIALLGVLKAGAAYVPLAPDYPAERLEHMVTSSGLRMIVTDGELAPPFGRSDLVYVAIRSKDVSSESSASLDLKLELSPERLAYVLYTSGSTGKPKGVSITHGAMVNLFVSMSAVPGLTSADTLLALTTISFDMSVPEQYLPLLVGGKIVYAEGARARDPNELARLIAEHGVTVMQGTPSTWRMLLDAGWSGKQDLKAIIGGEALPESLAARLRPMVGELWNFYGPTETTVWSSCCQVVPPAPVRLGAPIRGTSLYVLDPNTLERVPVDGTGELFIGGIGLARGYWGRLDETAARFVPDPYGDGPGARMYRTGDLVRHAADGGLEYIGRSDHQVKIRGFRIELGEIESTLDRHGSVKECVVVARSDGGGPLRLVAYVVPSGGDVHAVDPVALRAHLSSSLPDYMIPSAFVAMIALPLGPTGKVDRKALPVPSEATLDRTAYAAPRTDAEKLLAGIWTDVLRLDRVSLHDNFFNIGGDSILAIQVLTRARNAGLTVSLRTLYEQPTLAGLATLLSSATVQDRREETSETPLLEPAERERAIAGQSDVEDAYPLTPVQGGILFHTTAARGSGVYVVQLTHSLRGQVSVPALRQAFAELVARHAIYRSLFVWDGLPRPVQVVLRSAEVPLTEEDWRHLAPTERAARLERFLIEDRKRGFDLSRPPLARVALCRTGDDTYELVWTMHHLITDGWSQPIARAELVAAYQAALDGVKSTLAPAPLFRPYLTWLAGRDKVAAERHWRARLDGFETPTPLPFAGPIEASWAADPEQVGTVEVELGLDLARLERCARRLGTTVATIVYAAWGLVLARYTGQDDVVFGTIVSGRYADVPRVEALVAPLINTIPVRVKIPAGERASALIRRLHAEIAADRAYEHSSLFDVQRWSAVPAGTPLSHTLFAFVHFPAPDASSTSLRIEAVRLMEHTNYPLSFAVAPVGDKLAIDAAYDRKVLRHSEIARLLGHLELVLTHLTTDHDPIASHIPMVTDGERTHLLSELAPGPRTAFDDALVPALVAQHARERPDAIALAGNGSSMTYGELDRRARQLAHRLRALGVGPDVAVGVALPRSIDFVVAALGAWNAGAPYVPFDLTLPRARLAHMVEVAQPGAIVTTSTAATALTFSETAIVRLDDDLARVNEAHEPAVAVEGDSAAYVIFTSGSTGTPKGVVVPHRALANLVAWQVRTVGLGPHKRTAQFAATSFDVAVGEIWTALASGAELHIVPDDLRLDPPRLWLFLRERRVMMIDVPAALVEASLAEAARHSELAVLMTGGDRLVTRPPPHATHRLLNGYGPTETTVTATCAEVAPVDDAQAMPPIGRPIANVTAYVLDSALQPVAIGIAGELYLGGAGVARGYLGDPAATAARFVPDPFSSHLGSRLYRTGDHVRWREDGELDFIGRADAQVKLRGFRIELGEIEVVLLGHAAVRQCVVELRGIGVDKQLIAYIAGDGIDADELRTHLAEHVPAYMIPSAFVFLETLPMTPSGKVDRKALPEPTEDGDRSEPYVAPRDDVEETIARIWAELLDLERVGINDDFFELGGNSLLMMQLISEIRSQLGTDLPLRNLFDMRTVANAAALVNELRSGAESTGPSLTRHPDVTEGPVSSPQFPHIFESMMEQESPRLDVAADIQLEGQLDIDALHASLREIGARHSVLWTRFRLEPEGFVQHLEPADREKLVARTKELAVSSWVDAERAMNEVSEPLDPQNGPVARFLIARCSDDRHLLRIQAHNAVVDGMSIEILMKELEVLYRAFEAGHAPQLPELPVQYLDYALWEAECRRSPDYSQQVEFWQSEFRTAPPRLDVRENAGPSIFLKKIRLSADTGAALRDVARQQGLPFSILLLTLYHTAATHYLHCSDLPVALMNANRDRDELFHLIGPFATPLPVRLIRAGQSSLLAAAQSCQEKVKLGFANAGVRLYEISRLAGYAAPIGAEGLCAVSFNQWDRKAPSFSTDKLSARCYFSPIAEARSMSASVETVEDPGNHPGLVLGFLQDDDGLEGEVTGASWLWTAEQFTLFCAALAGLCRGIATDPSVLQRPIDEIWQVLAT